MIVVNRIMCLNCKDIIESYSHYDYKTCSCGECHTDSGPFIESAWRGGNYISLDLYDTDDFLVLRKNMKRINSRTNKYIIIKDMDDDYLDNCIGYCIENGIMDWYIVFLIKEKQYRFDETE